MKKNDIIEKWTDYQEEASQMRNQVYVPSDHIIKAIDYAINLSVADIEGFDKCEAVVNIKDHIKVQKKLLRHTDTGYEVKAHQATIRTFEDIIKDLEEE